MNAKNTTEISTDLIVSSYEAYKHKYPILDTYQSQPSYP